MLLESYRDLLEHGWQPIFPQQRSHHRAIAHALAWPTVLGERTIARTVCVLGRSQQDWSADYKIYSRSRWSSQSLFDPIVEDYLSRFPKGPIRAALDDTSLSKTGKKVPATSWQRDPMSPPFHVNLVWAQRFLQVSLLYPLHRQAEADARSLPVRFEPAPVVRKPGQRASEEDKKTYRQLKQQQNLSSRAVAIVQGLRSQFDQAGAATRRLLLSLDGSYCNRTVFKAELDRTTLIARCRKDARLCRPAAPGGRRRYDPTLFTPEQIRQNSQEPYKRVRLHYAGQRRWMRYKALATVLWKRGAGTRPLRLIVVAPQPYQRSKHAPVNYRDPAYLLTTDTTGPIKPLLQAYFDRWQIEVNHRDEKHWLGVGQAQVRAPLSVPRHPPFVVACYSLLLLASLRSYGPGRSHHYLPLPKWRCRAKRPSLLDLLMLLRQQINETSVSRWLPANFTKNLVRYAHT
jgi:hypothetical protein